MRRFSYPKRLFAWLLAYSLLLVGCFVAFQYTREREFKTAEINSQLQLIDTYILNELAKGKDVHEIDLKNFHPFDDLRLSVIASNGDIIYDNTLDSIRRTNHLDRQEIKDALARSTGYAVRRHSASTGQTYFYSAKLGDSGQIVRTAVPYSMSLDTLLQADYGFIWIMGAVTLVMCALGYFSTRRIGQHILRLNQFAENMEKGSVISDTEPFPHDELGEISNNIVRLYAKLQHANAERDKEHRAALREQQEKERIKKQLTNNINHELKTPVASIQACVETLLAHNSMSDDQKEMFLQRCLSNTKRLKRLLADVALITRMDDGGGAITKSPLRLSEIVGDVVADRLPLATAKNITIDNSVTRPLVINGNRQLLESVFSNLIDNAISHSGATGISIGIASVTDDMATLAFSDDGCGVADEHLHRIFERFYRVDKGRSRAAGGTGLGLSIVKNAVRLHDGEITARRGKSGGLAFTIALPLHKG